MLRVLEFNASGASPEVRAESSTELRQPNWFVQGTWLAQGVELSHSLAHHLLCFL